MPSLGADMEEGTILEWLVTPGDEVHKGDIVAVVDTAKAAVEVETFVEGVVSELLVDVGAKVPVGTPLARIGDHGDAARPDRPDRAEHPEHPEHPEHASPATPLIKTLATELGVDLATVTGTGARGRITRKDVERAAGPAAPSPAPAAPSPGPVGPPPGPPAGPPARSAPAARDRPETTRRRATPYARRLAHELGVELAGLDVEGVIDAGDIRLAAARATTPSTPQPPPPASAPPTAPPPTRATATPAGRQDRMRETIGRLMARSKREIPHYYLSTTVDLARARGWMQERNRDLPVSERLVPAALLLKATALALRKHPQLNGFWVDDAFVPGTGVHLGVAISLRGGGLVAPAIHDADALGVEELMAAVRDLVGRARAGRLRGSEMSDPTLTVTNLGDQGVESVHGVIYPPQVALVGFGRVVERPWAVDGMLAVRPVVSLTLAADHRATDGFSGGRLLATIDQLLQTPEEL
ncbi:MAG TPA: dihydrolipoamide acetyltransferase family protein [Ornithinibacter sp.]|nr:dihydrolipoamide acetyltransferase family protein [Ornithinibacter sp.]